VERSNIEQTLSHTDCHFKVNTFSRHIALLLTAVLDDIISLASPFFR
jgi:hypothetical protein